LPTPLAHYEFLKGAEVKLSMPATFTITPAAALIALESSTGSTAFGQPVTLTASVSLDGPGAGTPTGTVTFYDGRAALAAIPLDAAGRATLTIGSLGPGDHSIAAVYGGDADFLGGRSGAVWQSVSPADTRVILVPHAVLKGNRIVALSLTAEVEPLAPGGGVPTGAIAFMTKKKRLVTADLSNGRATLTLRPWRIPRESLTLVYGGGAGYRSSAVVSPKLTAISLENLARASREGLTARPAEHARTHGHS
jgi:large repetitive protein